MATILKTEIDPDDLAMVLGEDFLDEDGNFYNLSFGQALEEESEGEELLWCRYLIETSPSGDVLLEFLGYTENKVIFNMVGMGIAETLLDSIPRHPPISVKDLDD